MRISDWSSDVCSSDLTDRQPNDLPPRIQAKQGDVARRRGGGNAERRCIARRCAGKIRRARRFDLTVYPSEQINLISGLKDWLNRARFTGRSESTDGPRMRSGQARVQRGKKLHARQGLLRTRFTDPGARSFTVRIIGNCRLPLSPKKHRTTP